MDKWFHTTLYWACDNSSRLGLKLNYVSKPRFLSLWQASYLSYHILWTTQHHFVYVPYHLYSSVIFRAPPWYIGSTAMPRVTHANSYWLWQPPEALQEGRSCRLILSSLCTDLREIPPNNGHHVMRSSNQRAAFLIAPTAIATPISS